MTYNIGDRVRVLVDLYHPDWIPDQPDHPAGSLGTIESIQRNPFTGSPTAYSITLDDSADQIPAWVDAADVETAGHEA